MPSIGDKANIASNACIHCPGDSAAVARCDYHGGWLDSCGPLAADTAAVELATWKQNTVLLNTSKWIKMADANLAPQFAKHGGSEVWQ